MKAEDQSKQSQNQDVDAESHDQMELKTMVDAIAAASQREADAESLDQMELKTMVDAIATASQREAEAHETAVTLARENDELRIKLKVLIEDNEKLIKLHDCASVKAAEEMLHAIRNKLDLIEDNLSPTWEVVNYFGFLEKAANEVEATCSRFEDVDCNVVLKQQEIIDLGIALSNLEDRRTVIYKKLLALKTALHSISSKLDYCEERDFRAKVRYESCLAPLDLKNEELRRLHVLKTEMDTSCMNAKQSEIELRNNIDLLKMQLQTREAQRKESERVLFSIDNLDRNSLSEPNALNFGKASELLKSEEERTKITIEIKLREKLVTVQKEMTKSHSISESLNTKFEKVEALIRSESALLHETELA